MPKKPRPLTLVDQIREAVRESGMGIRELGRVSGVDPSRISRFMRGQSSIDVAAASAICEALGYELTKSRNTGAARRGSIRPDRD
jgi:transcriptional regulator with XRE-family HTH domain